MPDLHPIDTALAERRRRGLARLLRRQVQAESELLHGLDRREGLAGREAQAATGLEVGGDKADRGQLDALRFDAREWQELQAEHSRLAHAQALAEGVQFCLDALCEGDAAIDQVVAKS